MFHIVRHTPLGPLRAKTAVDLSGSLTLPSLNVPCSLTPPQSPATIALYGDLLLPSSHYDAVGLRFLTFTRLNRFTFVTARSSLVPTLNPCRCLHESKVRFSVGRLIPLSEAGISPAGSVRLSLTHHSVGTDSPRLGLRPHLAEFLTHAERRFRPPFSPAPSASVRCRATPTDNPYVCGPP
jgi:hypothetical protein